MDENKKKFALWIHPSTLEKAERLYRLDNCRSKSEFIEKHSNFILAMSFRKTVVIISPKQLLKLFKERSAVSKKEWLRLCLSMRLNLI